MAMANAIADHWAKDDVYDRIVAALEKAGKTLDKLTVEDLAPVDQFHARGFPATIDLADRLPVGPDHHILDIGCGIGGPARYFASRFGCRVTGVDLTLPFVEAGRKLTVLLGLEDRVTIEQGDGQELPFADNSFDGAYTQHVTMNVANRPAFLEEAFRVLKPGAFFALTEHGLGDAGNPHHPLPWSEDGSGAYLTRPAETLRLLEETGFEEIDVEDTGGKYLAFYHAMIERAENGQIPPLGLHVLIGEGTLDKARNAARNIAEDRTHPVMMICRKPS